MLAVLLPALFAPIAWPFELLTLVMIGAAGWEWARLNGVVGTAAYASGIALSAACAVALWAGWSTTAPNVVWWVATLVWVLGGAWAMKAGPAGWPGLSKALRLALGLVALWTAWLALANAKSTGINFILSIFCLVWAADIFAYFGGKSFG